MALSLPGPLPALNGKHHTAWRVAFVAISVTLTGGITAAAFLLIPAFNDSVKLALDEGGAVFVAAVIVPSGILSLITLSWGVRILWRASEDVPSKGNCVESQCLGSVRVGLDGRDDIIGAGSADRPRLS